MTKTEVDARLIEDRAWKIYAQAKRNLQYHVSARMWLALAIKWARDNGQEYLWGLLAGYENGLIKRGAACSN